MKHIKKKNYQKVAQDAKRAEVLKLTFRGFLISCAERNKEQRALKEVKALLTSQIAQALSENKEVIGEPGIEKKKKVDFEEELKMEV